MEKDVKQLKILVCSINAWNSKIGDNTFAALLSNLPKTNIASLFIREDAPDSSVCGYYFRISEIKVLRSILRPRTKTGEEVYIQNINNESAFHEQRRLYGKKQHFYYPKLFGREVVWMLGKWKSPELDEFIDTFAPDIVLYEMSRYIHLNRIVQYVIKRTGAKGIGCFWDDTFTYKQEQSFGFKFLRFFQRKSIKKLSKCTYSFFAITPKTKKEADAFLGINSVVLTKPMVKNENRSLPNSQFPLKMLYTGNLAIGREDTMVKIVEDLHEVNKDGIKLELDIYTNTDLSDVYKCKLNTMYSRLHDAISQEQVIEIQNKADILLFVEGIGSKNKTARLSFSTKITDYYAAGKCIFAVGDEDLAPMELFQEEKTAVIATNSRQILSRLIELTDISVVQHYAQTAYSVGNKKYSADLVRAKFYNVLTRE